MTLQEIKQAIRGGKRVCWSNIGYEVINPSGAKENPDDEQWLIRCTMNNHCIGLTWRDEVTMNGKEEDFFIDTSNDK